MGPNSSCLTINAGVQERGASKTTGGDRGGSATCGFGTGDFGRKGLNMNESPLLCAHVRLAKSRSSSGLECIEELMSKSHFLFVIIGGTSTAHDVILHFVARRHRSPSWGITSLSQLMFHPKNKTFSQLKGERHEDDLINTVCLDFTSNKGTPIQHQGEGGRLNTALQQRSDKICCKALPKPGRLEHTQHPNPWLVSTSFCHVTSLPQ